MSPASSDTHTAVDAAESHRPKRRLHPATELIILACSLLLVFGIPSPIVPVIILTGTVVTVTLSHVVRLRAWVMTVGLLCLPTLVVLIVVQGLFYPGTDVHVLWQVGPARLSVEGLSIAVQIWLRVSALIGLCALFGPGADSARLFDGLRRLRLPSAVAYMCASAIGLIPMIGARTRHIIEARQARGWATDSWRVRIRLLPGIVTGLVTAILLTVDQRHDVLESSGLNSNATATALQDHTDETGQSLLRILTPLVTIGLIVASVTGVLPLPGAAQLIGGA
ncbi:energy-coupling factor transporter transmembrane protein EcfT [Brevibacterium permense]|uniref:energy-coupling factor transporter transmembrane component T family protein n=1 Tax=Brevibacterium permense TaxID=234834 RepID=UPI0021D02510|nr:energy-coupling factor transporter transmembrane component T [Brevibacterium permense]MCU4297131.1 energy-coupling factor transporter transmembrane protein EcfT [Brevibacterium permense]